MSKRLKLTDGGYTTVDNDVYVWARHFPWHGDQGGRTRYAVCAHVSLHKVILPEKRGLVTDHVNRNGLDNRRRNLRRVTKAHNASNCGPYANNSSGFKGVSAAPNGRWRAYTRVNYRYKYLGTFKTAIEASRVYASTCNERFSK